MIYYFSQFWLCSSLLGLAGLTPKAAFGSGWARLGDPREPHSCAQGLGAGASPPCGLSSSSRPDPGFFAAWWSQASKKLKPPGLLRPRPELAQCPFCHILWTKAKIKASGPQPLMKGVAELYHKGYRTI